MTASAQELGRAAEEQACAYLQAKGLTLLARNYRSRLGEIDLVMGDQTTTVFVEVRYRHNARYGTAAETVTASKQRKIIAAAQHFLQRHPGAAAGPCRFDVVSVSPHAGSYHIDWISNAFDGY